MKHPNHYRTMITDNKDYVTSEVFCSVFGHNYKIHKRLSRCVDEYECKSCKQIFTLDEKGDFISLSPKYREIHKIIEYINKKRRYSSYRTFSSPDFI